MHCPLRKNLTSEEIFFRLFSTKNLKYVLFTNTYTIILHMILSLRNMQSFYFSKTQEVKSDQKKIELQNHFEPRSQCWVGPKIFGFDRFSVILKWSRSVIGHLEKYFGPSSVLKIFSVITNCSFLLISEHYVWFRKAQK